LTSAIEVVRQEINEQVRQRATAVLMLTSGDPEVEEPNDLGDLDSFSVVQLILSLEDYYQVPLLEDMPTFEGKTFEDLTEFVIARIDRQEAAAEANKAGTAG
jgi:acyl carrier protein